MPQARVLAVLMPADPNSHMIEWPTFRRDQLAIRAGYTGTSGSITRVMKGIRPGSCSGDAHLGLLALGLVEAEVFDIDGTDEVNYRVTPAGIRAYHAYVATNGEELPEVKDATLCTNDRYLVQTEVDGEEGG